jgi:hypothetical protein
MLRNKIGKYFLISFFLISSFISNAQVTTVTGRVYDPLTNEPIPFASVVFKSTTIGTNTDINGNYSLETMKDVDSISATFIGYLPATLKLKKGKVQVINFALRVNKFDLPEVKVKAGENPADIIMRKVRERKDKNDRRNVEAYQYEAYNKLEMDINNISEKFKKRRIFKPFKFIFDNIDSSETNKRPFLPVFISESLSDVYYKKKPEKKKEIIKAVKASGIENSTIQQFLGDFYQNINVYDNIIYLFGKGFISPLADGGNLFYKYYLLDSAFIDNNWCYKLTFKPRRKQELTFIGDMWINDTTWAVKKINMRIADDANINFIEDMVIHDDYEQVDKEWMLKKDILVINIAPTETKSKEKMGFIARKTTTYKDIVINKPKPEDFYAENNQAVTILEDASAKTEDFWQQNRHDSLSIQEKKIYSMVDTIRKVPAFQTYLDIINVIATGYLEEGPVDIGTLFSFYSNNSYEGDRIKLGGRTNLNFNDAIQLRGYAAYGTRDKEFKYSGAFEYYFKGKSNSSFGGSYKKDVEQLGQGFTTFARDNVIVTLLSRIRSTKFNSIVEERAFYETDIAKGLTGIISIAHKKINPLEDLRFTYYTDATRSDTSNEVNAAEVTIAFRYAYNERFIERKKAVGRKNGRISLGSLYPITRIAYTQGLKNILGSTLLYQKLTLRIRDKIYFGMLGVSDYEVEAGKIWKTVPYPLLEVHRGNETYTYDRNTFNLMNYYEFVSDQFVSMVATHRFNGFFLDKFPLLRKLKLRELVTANFLIGSVSQSNRNILVDPNSFFSLNKPYLEAGVGIENILKFGRIDLIKRFSYLEHEHISKFGIRFSFEVII